MDKSLRMITFRFNNYIDDSEVNDFCKKHDVVQICPPIAIPMEVYNDGRQCGNLVTVTVIYREEPKGYTLNK